MVTRQQHADAALQQWQALRSLPPEERLDALMREYFKPRPPRDVAYDSLMQRVHEEMSR